MYLFLLYFFLLLQKVHKILSGFPTPKWFASDNNFIYESWNAISLTYAKNYWVLCDDSWLCRCTLVLLWLTFEPFFLYPLACGTVSEQIIASKSTKCPYNVWNAIPIGPPPFLVKNSRINKHSHYASGIHYSHLYYSHLWNEANVSYYNKILGNKIFKNVTENLGFVSRQSPHRM